jgi:transposase
VNTAELLKRIEELAMALLERDALIVKLLEENSELKAKIAELERRLNQNSSNSSKPPSLDGFKRPKPKSLRVKSGKRKGGQKGRLGKTLEQVAKPDEINVHHVLECTNCQTSLQNVEPDFVDKRQVFEIPEPKMNVIEHQCEKKFCPSCGELNAAPFPEGVEQPVQYGPRTKALIVYLQNYQLLPYERLSKFFEDVFGASISQGTVFNVTKSAYKNLAPFESEVKELLKSSDVLHSDESGLRVGKELKWLHSVSNEELTYYHVHERRGIEAMDAGGVLPHFKGTLVHDCWSSYFSYNFSHALCNAHLLRELNGIIETTNHQWANQMRDFLRKVNKANNDSANGLFENEANAYIAEYQKILADGYIETGGPPPIEKTLSRNLWERLLLREDQVLRFVQDPNVPFDNNQAERDLRMIKIKQKVSGCFRSKQGADCYARIRGYISTMKKQCKNIMDALISAMRGQPVSAA